jgi:hypothetical protein
MIAAMIPGPWPDRDQDGQPGLPDLVSVSARQGGQEITTSLSPFPRLGMEHLLPSPKQEVSRANPLFWTSSLLCDEVAVEQSRKSKSAIGHQGLLVSRCQSEGTGYRNGAGNTES